MIDVSKDDHAESNPSTTAPLPTGLGVGARTATDEANPDRVNGAQAATRAAMTAADTDARSATDQEAVDREADRQAGAMGANLRQDVAAWAAGREGASARANAAPNPPVDTAPASAAPTKRATPRVRKAAVPATEEVTAKAVKKPFSMSYSGVTTAQHIQSMIDRGVR